MNSDTGSKPRQAVVVIHGIGEQRPMQTLRGFVGAVLGASTSKARGPVFFSKPDRLTDTLELRRLTASKDLVPAPTDFYELYWAHLMEGTVWSHITGWVGTLMLRVPRSARAPIKLLWFSSWGLAVAGAFIAWHFKLFSASPQDLLSYGALGLAAALLLRLAGGVGLHYVGDAARYLSPTPKNINARKNIRNAVIQLLTKLHEEQPARYERIVVVGHSLGSVIAYDALTHLWQMRHSRIHQPQAMEQPRMASAVAHGQALSADPGKAPAAALEGYRRAQRALLAEQQQVGIDWRISDLVTLGSPLAHASFLLASSPEEWAELKYERAYPTSPPQLEDLRDEGRTEKSFAFRDGARFDLHILHHAALFACTRWTNLYFPSDLIGGPVSGGQAFGPGVKDVALPGQQWATRFTPVAHVRYWAAREDAAVKALRAALDLGDECAPPRQAFNAPPRTTPPSRDPPAPPAAT